MVKGERPSSLNDRNRNNQKESDPDTPHFIEEPIIFDPQKDEYNNSYFSFLLEEEQLSEEEKELLKEIINQGKLFMRRQTELPKDFVVALNRHCEEFHGGITLITSFKEAFRRLARLSGLLNNHSNGENPQEEESMRVLEELSAPSISFQVKDQEGLTDEQKRLLDKLNQISNRYELPYNILLAISEIEKGQTLASLLLVAAGFIYGLGADKLPINSEKLKMILAHGIGDAITMLTAAVDRVKIGLKNNQEIRETNEEENKKISDVVKFFGLAGINFDKLPDNVKRKILRLSHSFAKFKESINYLLTLSISLSVALLGSNLAEKTDNLLPFLLVAPINTSLIVLWEIFNRYKKLKNNHLTFQEVEKLINIFGNEWLAKIIGKDPYLVLAIEDFLRNYPSFGTLIGSLISVPSILILEKMFPQIPKEFLYSLSAMIFEGGASLINTFLGIKKNDPWKTFLKLIEIINKNKTSSS